MNGGLMSDAVIVWEPLIESDSFVTAEENLLLALSVEKPPGFHVCVVTDSVHAHSAEIVMRRAGFEIRDSLRWFYNEGGKPKEKTIVLGRKPLEGTVVNTVLKYGQGVINIEECRVGETGGQRKTGSTGKSVNCFGDGLNGGQAVKLEKGRWPANILWDGSDVVKAFFPKDTFECFFNTSEKGEGVNGLVEYLRLMVETQKFVGGEQ